MPHAEVPDSFTAMEKEITHKHDTSYKKIFSNPRIVEELITSFVNEEWVHEIDYSNMERIDKSFVTAEFLKRESDVIYKAQFKGKDVYIYLLIEFQSTVDRYMSLRILRYICEFYEYLVETKGLKMLPAIFPVMLYNGDDRWTAPENVKDLIEESISSAYIPDFKYYKIAENEVSKETLLKIKNFVSALFYMENSTPDTVTEDIEEIVGMLNKDHPEEMELFKNWLKYIFKADREIIEYIERIQEGKTMFATALKKHDEILIQQGMQQGMQQGIIQSRTDVISRMLKKNFAIEQISEVTGASVEEIAIIAKNA